MVASPASVADWVSDHSVALLPYRPNSESIGSALAIEVMGRHFLATAAHNLRHLGRLDRVRALPGGRRFERGLHLLDWNAHPSSEQALDVAWIEVEAVSAATSSARFLPVSSLSVGIEHREDTTFWVQGYPEQAVEHSDVAMGTPLVTSLNLGTMSLPEDSWSSFHNGVDVLFQWPPRDLGPYETMLPEAWGVSGGGVWIVPRFNETPEWGLADLRLGAVSRAWYREERRLVATRIEHWLQLLADNKPFTRKEIDPLLEVMAKGRTRHSTVNFRSHNNGKAAPVTGLNHDTRNPDVVIFLGPLAPHLLVEDLVQEAKAQGLSVRVEQREPQIMAVAEWAVPVAAILFATHKFFGTLLQEAAKDAYPVLKKKLLEVLERCLNRKRSLESQPAGRRTAQTLTVEIVAISEIRAKLHFEFSGDLGTGQCERALEKMIRDLACHYDKGATDDSISVALMHLPRRSPMRFRFHSQSGAWAAVDELAEARKQYEKQEARKQELTQGVEQEPPEDR